MKYEWVLAKTCTADYWPGHYRAHVAVHVGSQTTLADVKEGILQALFAGDIGGNDDTTSLLLVHTTQLLFSPDMAELDHSAAKVYRAARAAANRLSFGGRRKPFRDLEDLEDGEMFYAYFILREV